MEPAKKIGELMVRGRQVAGVWRGPWLLNARGDRMDKICPHLMAGLLGALRDIDDIEIIYGIGKKLALCMTTRCAQFHPGYSSCATTDVCQNDSDVRRALPSESTNKSYRLRNKPAQHGHTGVIK